MSRVQVSDENYQEIFREHCFDLCWVMYDVSSCTSNLVKLEGPSELAASVVSQNVRLFQYPTAEHQGDQRVVRVALATALLTRDHNALKVVLTNASSEALQANNDLRRMAVAAYKDTLAKMKHAKKHDKKPDTTNAASS